MSTTEQKKIFSYVHDLGCCLNCSVRYLCDRRIDFSDINEIVKKKELVEVVEDEVVKKAKSNPCMVCLGLLQDVMVEEILGHPDMKTVSEYDSEVFTVSISMPAAVLLREHSMRLHLEEKFPLYFNEDNTEIPINRVWKMFVAPHLAPVIKKTFQNSDICPFSINVTTDYEPEIEELAVLKQMQPKIFETRKVQHRKFSGELFSRKGVLGALSVTSSGIFKMHGHVPPEIPDVFLKCKEIQCMHKSIYVAGRYCKYSRELSQSPWIIDGVKTMETSVQEIMFEQFKTHFKFDEGNMKFSSSGREDCDVRCLGRGRPFYVEFTDPKTTEFPPQLFREVENAINRSNLISVRDLQKVERNQLAKVKEGEETKTKSYVALCVTQKPIDEESLAKINNHGSLHILQKTPIRVLHRRPLAIRMRQIEEMKANLIPEHSKCFELHVVTQAGTYVKEFIHGDFGRTKPNLGEILGMEVDIIALDVTSINLDWPEPVNYEQIST